MPGYTKCVPLVGFTKVEGSNSGTGNLALDDFCAADGKHQTDFFHKD